MRVISVYEEMMRFFMNNLYFGHLVYIISREQHFHMNLPQKKMGYTSVGSVSLNLCLSVGHYFQIISGL